MVYYARHWRVRCTIIFHFSWCNNALVHLVQGAGAPTVDWKYSRKPCEKRSSFLDVRDKYTLQLLVVLWLCENRSAHIYVRDEYLPAIFGCAVWMTNVLPTELSVSNGAWEWKGLWLWVVVKARVLANWAQLFVYGNIWTQVFRKRALGVLIAVKSMCDAFVYLIVQVLGL